jgi:hypothetical protein
MICLVDAFYHTKIGQEDRLDRLRIIRRQGENTSGYSYKSFYKFLEPKANDLVSCPTGKEKSFVLYLMKNKANHNLTDSENRYKFAPYVGAFFGILITQVVLKDILGLGNIIEKTKEGPIINNVHPFVFLIASSFSICLFLYIFSVDAKKWRDIIHVLEDISF